MKNKPVLMSVVAALFIALISVTPISPLATPPAAANEDTATPLDYPLPDQPQPAEASPAVQDTAATTSSGLTRNGRWFQYNSSYPYLIGYDMQEIAADPAVNYSAALDTMVQHGINKVRIWIYPYFGGERYLQPWPISNGRYNLDQWNNAYWSRVRDFVAQAQARTIIVEVSIFSANVVDESKDWNSTNFKPAWNKTYNSNNAFTANAQGLFSPQFYQLGYAEKSSSGATIANYQQRLIDKTVAELGGYPNVYFELCNEFPGTGGDIHALYSWQLHWLQHLRNRTARLLVAHAHQYVGDHVTGVQYFQNEASVDVLNFHTGTDPATISRLFNPIQRSGKVIQSNEGGEPYNNLDGATRGAWGYFMAGGYYTFYEDQAPRYGSSQWVAGAQRLRVLRSIAENNRFWELSPINSSGQEIDGLISQGPASNWQLIAKPGETYIAYLYNNPSSTALRINLPSGSYRWTWYDARNGATRGQGTVSGSSSTTIAAPSTSAWSGSAGLVLVLRRSSV